ncbi:MAG TPA: S41 family peptidase [Candidatus Cybelea sp.]|jgi:carboxyl-terminal processing protease|nr:S41 family peptidase [Candidatus Cybelea sp.]
MSPFTRLFITALLVVAVAAAGAVFIGYRTGLIAQQSVLEVASTGDLRGLLPTHDTPGSEMADVTLRRLESVYYKPISPQTPLAGESSALKEYLSSKKVPHVSLPAEQAGGDPVQDGERAAQLLAYAQQHYADSLASASASDDLTDAALRGIMNSVHDPYTVYLSPREDQGLNESLSGGNFGGIGVYIFQLRDGRIVVQPIVTMPAARAGMKAGEIVDSVNGRPVKGMLLDKVEGLIRGPSGTVVHLRAHPYSSPAAEKSYAIVREIIHVPTVQAKMEEGFDYIRLSDFGTTSGDEVRKALLDGKAKGARGYILDLRDNGGGLLDAAVSISSLFVPQGTIVSTIRRDGSRTTDSALGDAIGGLQPLVILVNKYTASASEITSGALQDYHLATLIGTRTFGKGVVQSIFPFEDQLGALKITTARYLTPAGRDIQHHGIEPNVTVEQDPNPSLIDTPADKQLAAAKARLRSQLR